MILDYIEKTEFTRTVTIDLPEPKYGEWAGSFYKFEQKGVDIWYTEIEFSETGKIAYDHGIIEKFSYAKISFLLCEKNCLIYESTKEVFEDQLKRLMDYFETIK